MVGACGGGGARSGGGGANGLVRLPVSQRDGKVVGPGEAEAFAQEAEVPAPSPLPPMRKLLTRSREQATEAASEVGPDPGAEAGCGDGGYWQ